MPRTLTAEISEHDSLVEMMARHFKRLGYSEIKADIPGWPAPDFIYWTNNPNRRYVPDLTCYNDQGIYIILEAETCSSFNDQHTREQFDIFRARSTQVNGRFEVVVPRLCHGSSARDLISNNAGRWGIVLDNIWIPRD